MTQPRVQQQYRQKPEIVGDLLLADRMLMVIGVYLVVKHNMVTYIWTQNEGNNTRRTFQDPMRSVQKLWYY